MSSVPGDAGAAPGPAFDTDAAGTSGPSGSSESAQAAGAALPPRPVEAWPGAVAALLSAFNHVLGQHAWARERLSPYGGQAVRAVVGTPLGEMTAAALIRPEGLLEPAPAGVVPAVTLHLRQPLDALVAAAGQGMPGAMQHLRIDGDAGLAAAIGQIAPHLRWDAEDDMARFLGDVPARRLGRLAERLRDGLVDLRHRVESGAVAYLVHEEPQLVSAPMLEGFRGSVRMLRDDLDRMEKRIERLEQQPPV